MKRFAFLAVGLLAFLAGILWLLREEPPPPEPGEQARQLSESMRDRAARPPPREELSADGALDLQGRVLAPDGSPVGGVLLSVTARATPAALSGLPCVCEDSCPPHRLDGSCPQSAVALLERVAAREGEPPVLARTTSAADGSFVLRGLEASDYRVWADSERGVATAEISGNQRTVELTLEEGWMLTGKIVGGDRQGLAGAVVTAVDSELGRYQDVLSAADGTFSLGPLPTHPQLVVASLGALLPSAKEVTPDQGSEALVLRLETPLRIEGQVLRDDVPVEGAEVALSGMHRTDTLRSGASGRFAFEQLRSGTYSVRATEGKNTAEAALNLMPQKPSPPLVLRLEEGGVLMGTVRAQDGAPVPGAQVRVSIEAPGVDPTRETVSDAQGNFRIDPLLPGQATVWAVAEGYLGLAHVQRVVFLDQPAHVELKLERAVALSGVVVDEEGRPVQGVKVVGAVSLKGGDDATTGADGRFTLAVGAGPVRFTAKHTGFRDHASTPTAPSSEVRVILQRGLQLRGRVLDEAGIPMKGARVMALAPGKGGEDEKDLERVTESGPGGNFLLGGLEPGAFLLAALVEEGEGAQRAMRMGATRVVLPFDGELTVRLKAGASLRGVVVDQHGQPAPGIELMALLEGLSGGAAPPVDEMVALLEAGSPFGQGRTGEDGRFEIRNLRPGRFELSARAAGFEPLETQARSGEKELRLVVRRLPRLSGRVLGADGQPLTRFSVRGVPVESTDGRFEEPLAGPREVTIRAPEHVEWRRTIRGAAEDLDLGEIRLSRGTTVGGRVVDQATGAGIPGALVGLQPAGAGKEWTLSIERGAARTDREGRFQLRHVEPGEGSRLYGAHPDYEQTAIPWSSGEPVVPLTRLATLRGTLVLANGEAGAGSVRAVRTSNGAWVTAAHTVSGGSFELKLAAGDYRLEVSGPRPFQPVEVSVGAADTVGPVEMREQADGG